MVERNLFDFMDPPEELRDETNIFEGIEFDAFLTTEELEKKTIQPLIKIDKTTFEKYNKPSVKFATLEQKPKTPFGILGGMGLAGPTQETQKFMNIRDEEERKKKFVEQHPKWASLASGVDRLVPATMYATQDILDQVHKVEDINKFIESEDPKAREAGIFANELLKVLDPTRKLDMKKTAAPLIKRMNEFNVVLPGDDKGIIGLVQDKEYAKAADLGYRQALQSAPISTMAGIMTMSGHPGMAAIIMGVPVYGEELHALEEEGVPKGLAREVAMHKAMAEAGSEVMGAVIGLGAAKAITKIPRQQLFDQTADLFRRTLRGRLTKYGAAYVVDSNLEGFEELVNKVAGNATDYQLGLSDDPNIFRGAMESYVSGSVSAMFMEAPSQVAMAHVKNVQEQQAVQMERFHKVKEQQEDLAKVESIVYRKKEEFITEPVTDKTGAVIMKGKLKKGVEFVTPEEMEAFIEEPTEIEITPQIEEISKLIETDINQAETLMAELHKAYTEEQLATSEHEAVMKKLQEAKDAMQEEVTSEKKAEKPTEIKEEKALLEESKLVTIINTSKTGKLREGVTSFFTTESEAEFGGKEFGDKQISKQVDENLLFIGDSSAEYLKDENLWSKKSDSLLKEFGVESAEEAEAAFDEGVPESFKFNGKTINPTEKFQRSPNSYWRITQRFAEDSLKEKGYPGTKWLSEDEMTPIQYQIWDKSILHGKEVDLKPEHEITDVEGVIDEKFRDTTVRDTEYLLQENQNLDLLKEGALTLGQDLSKAVLVDAPKLTTEKHLFSAFAKAVTGNNIVWVKNFKGNSGAQFHNRIWMDIKSTDVLANVSLHEAVHQIAKYNKDGIKEIYDAIEKELIAKRKDPEAVWDHYRRQKYDDLAIKEEIVAFYVGSKHSDPGFWDKIAEYSPGFVKDLISEIKKIITKVKKYKFLMNSNPVRRMIKDLEAEARIDIVAAKTVGEHFELMERKADVEEEIPYLMRKIRDSDRGIRTKDMNDQQYPFTAVLAGHQTSDESMDGYKINGKNVFNKDAPTLDNILEEISDSNPYVFNQIADDAGKFYTSDFVDKFVSEYDKLWNEQNQPVETEEEATILEEAQKYQELMEKLQDVKHGNIPKDFRQHIESVKLPSRSKASRLFGLLGNKNTSIPLFENIYEKWVKDGVENIFEPYAGAFTLGTHSLRKAIEAGLKEYHANVFDKEKFMIIQAIRDGKQAEVTELLNKAIEEFTVAIYKESAKHPVVEEAFTEFTKKYPDSYVGSNEWLKFTLYDTNIGADAVNYPDVYDAFRKVFQTVMNEFAIDRTEIKNLSDAVKVAFSNVIGVSSGKSQSMISSNGFKSFENVVHHPKYGMAAAINQTAEIMKLAKEKGTEINIYTEDGVEFLNRLDEVDKSKTGIYLDPPYIKSALNTYEEQSIEDRSLLNKFMVPEEFIKSHEKALLAAKDDGAKIALTNDSSYQYMKALRDNLGDPAIFIYKEGSTPTSLILDQSTSETAQEYFDRTKVEKKAGIIAIVEDPEITKEKTHIRHLIHLTAAMKMMPKAEMQRITKKITGHADMSGERNKLLISVDEYQKVLEKVKRAYPRRSVKGEVVITEKTETKIQELKNHLINQNRMTQEHFEGLVSVVTGKQFFEPRYIHRHKYVTNSQGRQIIKAMIDSSSMIAREIKIEQAIEKAPIIKESIDRDIRILSKKYAKEELADVTSGFKPMLDMRYFTNLMEKATGIPFGRVHMELINARHEADRMVHEITDKMHENISQRSFRDIINNESSLLRIEHEVASNLPQYIIGKPAAPLDITADEKKIADYITKTLQEFEGDVRFFRFMEYYNQHQKNIDKYSPQEFKHSREEWIPNAPPEAIREAVRILETKGAESLRKWLDTQTWGVIRTGYDIGEVIDPKMSKTAFTKAGISRAHLQARTDVRYSAKDRDIVTRFASYVRQMVFRKELNSEINAWTYMVNTHIDEFTDPSKLKSLLQDNLTEILGKTEHKRLYEKFVFDLYAQAARTIFLNPKMGVRNLMQNVAFHTGIIQDIKGMKKLTESEKRFFETHVSQMSGIVRDLLFQQYNRIGRIPGFKQLNKFADWANVIGRTDTMNRLWDFSMTLNRIKKAIKAHPQYMNTTTEFNKMMKQAGFGDMTSIERIHAKEILAVDGVEAFRNYVAGQIVKKDHFQYDRYLRAPAEQGSDLVKLLSNLTTFPKGYIQRQALDIKKMTRIERELAKNIKGTNRAIQSIIWSTIIGQAIATATYQIITGDDDNDPYSFMNIAFKFSLGGIALGAQKEFFTFTKYLLQAATGDEWAQKQLPKTVPRNLNMFIPMFKIMIDILESTTNTKYIDHYFLKKLLGQKAEIEDYKLIRGTHKSIQHAVFGTRPHTIHNRIDDAVKDIRKNGYEEGQLDYLAEELDYAVEMEYITQDKRMKMWDRLIRANDKFITGE